MNTAAPLLASRSSTTSSTTGSSLSLALALLLTMQERPSSSSSSKVMPNRRSSSTSTSRSPSPPLYTAPSTPLLRPHLHRRTSSLDSQGWYGDGITPQLSPEEMLEGIAARLNTAGKRFERFTGQCAQNVVMALLRPTPVMLFALHPVLLLCLFLGWMMWATGWI